MKSQEVIKIINEKLPSNNSPGAIELINYYWPRFDCNGNGYLSLAEVDKGIRDVIRLPELFKLKPVIIKAFNMAKTKLKAVTKYGDDYVSKAQFRYLLQYLREYYCYWSIFNQIDTSKDRRISLQQFQKAVPLMQSYGIPIPNAKKIFAEIDSNHGGFILFDQFCYWILEHHFQFKLTEGGL